MDGEALQRLYRPMTPHEAGHGIWAPPTQRPAARRTYAGGRETHRALGCWRRRASCGLAILFLPLTASAERPQAPVLVAVIVGVGGGEVRDDGFQFLRRREPVVVEPEMREPPVKLALMRGGPIHEDPASVLKRERRVLPVISQSLVWVERHANFDRPIAADRADEIEPRLTAINAHHAASRRFLGLAVECSSLSVASLALMKASQCS